MADTEATIQHEVQQLQARDDVRAIAVVGSYARDPDQHHNDIDLYIIIDGDWRKRETERVDGHVIERFYNSMAWSKRYLDSDGWYTNYRWFTGADIRYDPDDLFTDLTRYATMKKDEHTDPDEDDRQAIRYFIWDMQQDIEQADGAQQTYLQHQLFDYLLQKDYLLQGAVPVKENYRIEKLAEIDPEMHQLATAFLDAGPDQRKGLLDDMVDHVTAEIGEPDPEWETAREAFDD